MDTRSKKKVAGEKARTENLNRRVSKVEIKSDELEIRMEELEISTLALKIVTLRYISKLTGIPLDELNKQFEQEVKRIRAERAASVLEK